MAISSAKVRSVSLSTLDLIWLPLAANCGVGVRREVTGDKIEDA